MRTSIYINTQLLEKLLDSAEKVSVTKNKMITLLLARIIRKTSGKTETFNAEELHCKPVKYQKSAPGVVWKIEHIRLEPLFYEKGLELRRHFKHSVSWFISYAIVNYLDELVEEMSNPDNPDEILDNYEGIYIYIARMIGKVHVFLSILGFPEDKDLKNIPIH